MKKSLKSTALFSLEERRLQQAITTAFKYAKGQCEEERRTLCMVTGTQREGPARLLCLDQGKGLGASTVAKVCAGASGGASARWGGLQSQAMQISVRDNAICLTWGRITSPLEISCSLASLMILYSRAPRVIFPTARDIHLSVQSRSVISARLLDLGCAHVNKKDGVCRQHAALPLQP